jgi:RNase P protein component
LLRDQEILHEAHLSTEQSQASDEARIPGPQGNPWWPGGTPFSPAQGPSQAECVTASVTRRSTFAALSRSGDRARHGVVRLRHLAVDHPDMQPGTPVAVSFAFSRRFGSAVDRNRAKRRLRAAFVDAGGSEHRGSILMSGTRELLDRSYGALVDDVRQCLELVDPRPIPPIDGSRSVNHQVRS